MSYSDSNVYVVWSQTVGSSGLQIFVATSKNYGDSFGVAVQVTSESTANGFITPVIASAGDSVYVSYDNTTVGYAYLTSSSKAGAAGSWTKPIEADSCLGNGPCPEPQLYASGSYAYDVSDNGLIETSNGGASWHYVAIGGDYSYVREPWIWGYGSNVYIVFETGGTTSETFFTRSTNDGATWSNAVALFPAMIPDSWNQQVGAYGNKAWIALQEYPGGSDDKIWVFSSQNQGSSWSTPKLVGSGGVTSYPFTVATSNGEDVYTAWSKEISAGHWIIEVAYSTNGATWSGPYNASNNSNGEAGNNNDDANAEIAASGSTLFVVWQFIDGSSSQIYFSKS